MEMASSSDEQQGSSTKPRWVSDECLSCHSFEVRSTSSIGSRSLTLNTNALELGRRSGCELCGLLLQCLTEYGEPLEGLNLTLVLKPGHPVIIARDALGKGGNSVIGLNAFELYRTGPFSGNYGNLPQFQDLSAEPTSDEVIAFIVDNLQQCIRNHPECREDITELPTRLIQIHSSSNEVQLVTPSAAQKGKYAALSYCWGSNTANLPKLKADTLQTFARRFNAATLPPLHRDAIFLCQKLGVEYLWIDSLCILQDDAEDWAREASKMASLYQNAHFTICASSCSSPYESFLAARRVDSWRCAWKSLASNSDQEPNGHIKVRRAVQGGRHSTTDASVYQEIVKAPAYLDPLERRGWTFQEFHLARRLIVFSSEEVQWLCTQAESCECRPDLKEVISLRRILLSKELSRPVQWSFQELKPMSQWEVLVSHYTRRDLTFGKDKLPALSGLAEIMSEKISEGYVAGLWKSSLTANLCWCIHSESVVLPAPCNYQAPSFSWASIDGQVEYPYRWKRTLYQAEILDVTCTLKSPNPFGEVLEGSITIKCLTSPALLSTPAEQFPRNDPISWLPSQPTEFFTLSFPRSDVVCGGRMDTSLEELTLSGAGKKTQHTVRRSSSAQSAIYNAPVLCLRIWVGEHRDLENEQHFCLVLGPSSTPGAYERLGLARIFNPTNEFISTWTVDIIKLV